MSPCKYALKDLYSGVFHSYHHTIRGAVMAHRKHQRNNKTFRVLIFCRKVGGEHVQVDVCEPAWRDWEDIQDELGPVFAKKVSAFR